MGWKRDLPDFQDLTSDAENVKSVRSKPKRLPSTYQPDGRISDPYNTLDTDNRPALLASFIGLDASVTGTLLVADQSAGKSSILQN